MNERNEKNDLHGQVSCEYCKKAIPASEAYQPEGEMFALYFCGIDCFDEWRREGEAGPGPVDR